jgi:hypothetical protein
MNPLQIEAFVAISLTMLTNFVAVMFSSETVLMTENAPSTLPAQALNSNS